MDKKVLVERHGKDKDYFLLDLSWLMYKGAYALSELSVNIGGFPKPTGHIYNVIKTVSQIKKMDKNAVIVLCVDGSNQSRKDINSEYKANREKSGYNIFQDTQDILSLCSLIPEVYSGFETNSEADDVMFSLSRYLGREINGMTYIYTGDNDLLQAVSNNVRVLRQIKDKKMMLLGVEDVFEKYGVICPTRLAVMRSIIGDSSDNLLGVARFPESLAKHIANHADIEDISSVLSVQKPEKVTKSIEGHLSNLMLEFSKVESNYRMMRLVETDFEINRYDSEFFRATAIKLMNKYKLRSLETFLFSMGIQVGQLGPSGQLSL